MSSSRPLAFSVFGRRHQRLPRVLHARPDMPGFRWSCGLVPVPRSGVMGGPGQGGDGPGTGCRRRPRSRHPPPSPRHRPPSPGGFSGSSPASTASATARMVTRRFIEVFWIQRNASRPRCPGPTSPGTGLRSVDQGLILGDQTQNGPGSPVELSQNRYIDIGRTAQVVGPGPR
jgi:hypothetical protein